MRLVEGRESGRRKKREGEVLSLKFGKHFFCLFRPSMTIYLAMLSFIHNITNH